MKTRRSFLICSLVFSIVALTILIMTSIVYMDAKKFQDDSERVIGTISEIYVHKGVGIRGRRLGSRSHDTRHVFVNYIVKGVEYNHIKIDYSNDNMREGDSIVLLYDRTNPGNVRSEQGLFIGVILFGGIGLIFAFCALIIGICFWPRRQRLKKTGIRYEATVSNVRCIMNVTVNKKHPYRVECLFVDPATGVEKCYKSHNVYEDLDKYKLQTVPLYIYPEFPSKYYIDVDEAIEEINLRKQKEAEYGI